MTETYYRTGKVNVDHTKFGGELSLFDFEGHRTLSNMAEKIASDLRFDEMCRKNWENNKKEASSIILANARKKMGKK